MWPFREDEVENIALRGGSSVCVQLCAAVESVFTFQLEGRKLHRNSRMCIRDWNAVVLAVDDECVSSPPVVQR